MARLRFPYAAVLAVPTAGYFEAGRLGLSITAANRERGGAVFTVRLPASLEAAAG